MFKPLVSFNRMLYRIFCVLIVGSCTYFILCYTSKTLHIPIHRDYYKYWTYMQVYHSTTELPQIQHDIQYDNDTIPVWRHLEESDGGQYAQELIEPLVDEVITRKKGETFKAKMLRDKRANDSERAEPSHFQKTRRCTNPERRKLMNDTCRKYNTSKTSYKGEHLNLLVDGTYKLVVCEVAMAGSLFMRRYLSSLKGGFDAGAPHQYAHLKAKRIMPLSDYPKHLQDHILTNFTKVIVVRHPFDRIKSIYYDRFHNNSALDQTIADRYHIKNHRHMKFEYFADYVLFTRNAGPWRSILETCHPCAINYDYVLKIESMYEDIKAFTTEVLRKSHTEIYTKVYHPGHYPNRMVQTDVKMFKEYGRVQESEIRKLLRLYEQEMEMFGYRFDLGNNNAFCGEASSDRKCC